MSVSTFASAVSTPRARATAHVAVNGRFLAASHPTGTHRSALQFTRGLLARCGEDLELTLHAPCTRAEACERIGVADLPCAFVETSVRGRAALHGWEQATWPRRQPGAVHLNLLNTASVVPGRTRQVTIVHDLSSVRRGSPHSLAFRLLARVNIAGGARRSTRVVCFSRHVAGELRRLLGVSDHRIRIVRQGAGFAPTRASEETPTDARFADLPYLLAVGSLQPHKNLRGVLEAFSMLRAESGDERLRLVVTGAAQKGYRRQELSLDRPGVVATGYVSDGELERLYRGALGLVYPSFEEGFGLPVVEAFQCRCPVITSDRSSLPEIAGDAALLVDPGRVESIRDAMRRVVGEPDLRAVLIERGARRAKHFGWEAAVDDLVRVLREFEGETTNG
jgi:glycosyltransferase involved in cell wall biosynthesis